MLPQKLPAPCGYSVRLQSPSKKAVCALEDDLLCFYLVI